MKKTLLIGAMLVAVAGCGSPRTPAEITEAKLSLPQVYVGVTSRKQIVAPIGKGVIVDPETKEEYFAALECLNPDCPSRQGSEPVLFSLPQAQRLLACPSCLKKRNLKQESPSEQAKYVGFVRPYVLPETKAGIEKLNDEYRRAFEYGQRQRER